MLAKRLYMDTPGDASLSEPSNDREVINKIKIDKRKSFGPDLKRPRFLQYIKSFLCYALPRHRIEIVITIFAVIGVGYLVRTWDVLSLPTNPNTTILSGSASNLGDWLIRLQAVFGIPTLVVALFVWLGEIREDWENNLPKRLSVFFFYTGKPVVVCRYAWLAGPDELRTWGQQVAKQAAGNEYLDFSPDVEAQKPTKVVEPNGAICTHYAVCFKLTGLNPFLKRNPGKCYYQNCVAGDTKVEPFPVEEIEALQVTKDWQSHIGC